MAHNGNMTNGLHVPRFYTCSLRVLSCSNRMFPTLRIRVFQRGHKRENIAQGNIVPWELSTLEIKILSPAGKYIYIF